MKKLFSKLSAIWGLIASWATNSPHGGGRSAPVRLCDRNADCPHHPANGGDCRHHWICDMLANWDQENVELEDREKHNERAINGKKNYQTRAGAYGPVNDE